MTIIKFLRARFDVTDIAVGRHLRVHGGVRFRRLKRKRREVLNRDILREASTWFITSSFLMFLLSSISGGGFPHNRGPTDLKKFIVSARG